MNSERSCREITRIAAGIAVVLPLLGLMTASSCADLDRGARALDAGGDGTTTSQDGGAEGGSVGDGDAEVSFGRDVHKLLVDGCGSCHAANGTAGSTAFILSGDGPADLASALPFVTILQPTASRLLTKGSGLGHGGGAIYRSETTEYRIILRWITGGAPP